MKLFLIKFKLEIRKLGMLRSMKLLLNEVNNLASEQDNENAKILLKLESSISDFYNKTINKK